MEHLIQSKWIMKLETANCLSRYLGNHKEATDARCRTSELLCTYYPFASRHFDRAQGANQSLALLPTSTASQNDHNHQRFVPDYPEGRLLLRRYSLHRQALGPTHHPHLLPLSHLPTDQRLRLPTVRRLPGVPGRNHLDAAERAADLCGQRVRRPPVLRCLRQHPQHALPRQRGQDRAGGGEL